MRFDRRASTRIAGALDVVERKTWTRVMKASLLAAALRASAAGLSDAQGPAAWLSCQRNNLCTINDRGLYPAGVTRRIPQKAASACSAAGFSYYLPVSEIELQIGCFVPAKQSYVRAYFPEDLGGTGGVQVWYGIGVLKGEEWNRDEGAVSLAESGGIENLAIARLIESARDTGTLHLTVPAEDGFTRHEAEINLAGSLPALSAVREKCATAFAASP